MCSSCIVPGFGGRKMTIDLDSWEVGYADGKSGHPSQCPANLNSFSYSSGYCEGRACHAGTHRNNRPAGPGQASIVRFLALTLQASAAAFPPRRSWTAETKRCVCDAVRRSFENSRRCNDGALTFRAKPELMHHRKMTPGRRDVYSITSSARTRNDFGDRQPHRLRGLQVRDHPIGRSSRANEAGNLNWWRRRRAGRFRWSAAPWRESACGRPACSPSPAARSCGFP